MKVLEIGCGDGSFWLENHKELPHNIEITVSDLSDGMLRDAKRTLGSRDPRFTFRAFDCQDIPYPDQSFDLVIANHVLFYCDDLAKACSEVSRVLRPRGRFLCSAYGSSHMKEITQLVTGFDDRIVLAADKLYDSFGRDNGAGLLSPHFPDIKWFSYPDSLMVTEPEPLIAYVLSCHGNQNQYILDRYKDFRNYVTKHTNTGFHITKDAGLFLCTKTS